MKPPFQASTQANGSPVWTADGRSVTFSSVRGRGSVDDGDFVFWYDLFQKPADGSGSAERLLTGSADTLFARRDILSPMSWSPDGRWLLFSVEKAAGGDRDIWVMPRDGARTPRPIITTAFDERAPRFSADGRWLAYSSDASGRDEVYVMAFPDLSNRKLVSRGGGTEPVWAPNGRELFYRAGETMMAVPVQTEPTFTHGTPEPLFAGRYQSFTRGRSYDVHPDGDRFVMIQPPGSTHLVVVLNWFEELKDKVGNR